MVDVSSQRPDRNNEVQCEATIKVVGRSEDVEDDGTIIQRERERFSSELTLVFASGRTAILH